jgi:hypothetical protein
MAYDEDLANRIRELIAAEPTVTEKRMFGAAPFEMRGRTMAGGLRVRPEGLRTSPSEL